MAQGPAPEAQGGSGAVSTLNANRRRPSAASTAAAAVSRAAAAGARAAARSPAAGSTDSSGWPSARLQAAERAGQWRGRAAEAR